MAFRTPHEKNKEGVYIQAYMTVGVKALTTHFLRWQENQEKLETLVKPST